MTFAVPVRWRLSASGVVAVGLVGLILLGMVAAWVSPESVIGAARRKVDACRPRA